MKRKIAVITGVSGYLGQKVLREYKKLGYYIIGIDRTESKNRVLKLNKAHLVDEYFLGDLADPNFARDIQKTDLYKKKISVLVNCVGGSKVATLNVDNYALLTSVVTINLFTLWNACALFIPVMKRYQYGRVINIASTFALKSSPGSLAYTSAKASVVAFTKALALECASDSILVNVISPGHIKDSPRHASYFKTKFGKAYIERAVPLQKLCSTDEIVAMIMHLTSEKNQSITGQNIIIDGGATL